MITRADLDLEREAMLAAVDTILAESKAEDDARFNELLGMLDGLKGQLNALESRAATARQKGKGHAKR